MKTATALLLPVTFLALSLLACGGDIPQPTRGFRIVWQGPGGIFIESAEDFGRHAVAVTIRAHGFKLTDRDGMQQAKSALDLASAQVIATLKTDRRCAGKQLVEAHRDDRERRGVLTRTLELTLAEERTVQALAEERKRRQEAEEKAEKEKRQREQQEKEKAQEEKKRAQEQRPQLPPRKLEVRLASDNPANRGLRRVSAAASVSLLVLTFDFDAAAWPADLSCCPLVIYLFDPKEQPVALFPTPDCFIPEAKAPSVLARTFTRAEAAQAIRLKATGNKVACEVDPRILQRAVAVEIGLGPPRQ
jgi:hypothetical protein